MNDFKENFGKVMERLSAERDFVSSAKIRAEAERPQRKISARRILCTAAAVCGVLICGVTAACATGIIDFDAVFGNRISVNDSELADSLVGTVKNFKYKVSDKDYKIDIKGVTGDDKRVVVIAEILRTDGTPVIDCFANPVSPDERQLVTLSQVTKVSSLDSFGYGIDYRIGEEGNIKLSAELYNVGLDGKKMTFKGENFYPAVEYNKYERQNETDGVVQTEYVKYRDPVEVPDNGGAAIDLNDILALDMKWEFSFTYRQSDKSKQVKSLNAPEESFPLNLKVHTVGTKDDFVRKLTAQPSYMEAGSTGGRVDYVYKNTGYVGNLTYVTDVSECNEIYIIMKDGERVEASIGSGCETPEENIITCSYDLFYWDEDSFTSVFINADDIAAISINGTVYELN